MNGPARPRVGLLPLYLKLYDDGMPELRPRVEKFYRQIAAALEARGLQVLTSPVCRIRPEFLAAYSRLGGTHHLALSYGASAAVLCAFGRLMGWDVQSIG